jgi:colanic acid biosynthesis glycosyl transferase WcaI
MRIVVWGINYAPEYIGIAPCNTALCEFLAKTGKCDVTMLTSFPYYPFGSEHATEWVKRRSVENLVHVARCWMYVPRHLNLLTRLLHEASFIVSSSLRLLTMRKPDLVIVIAPPFLLGPVARIFQAIRGSRYVIHIQDLQPDAAVRLGMLKRKALIRLAHKIAAFGDAGAWRVSAISQGMLDRLADRGVPQKKLICFPNGIGPQKPQIAPTFRALHGFGKKDFLMVYSGNLGVKQGLDRLVKAARYLKNEEVQMVICGGGVQKERLDQIASRMANVKMMRLLDDTAYQHMLADADLMVVSLLPGTGSSFLPSKLLSACAAGKAVLGICDRDSELARVIEETNCGIVFDSESPEQIARKIDEIASNRSFLGEMGRAGREFVERLSWEELIAEYVSALGITKAHSPYRSQILTDF